MPAVALRSGLRVRLDVRGHARLLEGAALAALMAASLALRVSGLGHRLSMDEAISVGIAAHPLTDIPSVLRLDGSPPLYYVLVHLWMGVAGRSETTLHALSAAFAVLCVPAAWWAGLSVRDRRTGWVAAVLVACSPFVSRFAGEARMYTLVVALGFVCVACFTAAYVDGRRSPVWFGVALALLLYTHNWALFLGAAFALAFTVMCAAAPRNRRRALLLDGAVGFGIAALLYLPWLATAVFQARHTGAPWATAPRVRDLAGVPAALLGGRPATLIVVLAAAAGLAASAVGARREGRGLVATLAILAAFPVLLGWIVSQASPAWAVRYLAIVVAPTLLLAAIGIGRARRAGPAVLALVCVLWATAATPAATGDIVRIALGARPLLHPGDLVVSAAPGQVPLLAYYLPRDVHFASPLGVVRDPGVMDWRDLVSRLDRTSVSQRLSPLLARAHRGSTLILVVPEAGGRAARRTPLAQRVARAAAEDERALLHDRRFVLVARLPRDRRVASGAGTYRALVFRKRA